MVTHTMHPAVPSPQPLEVLPDVFPVSNKGGMALTLKTMSTVKGLSEPHRLHRADKNENAEMPELYS